MRKLWDQRFESGHMLARYDRTSFAFYTVMKGMGWLVYPRDIVGIQKNYHPEDGSEKGERMIVQTTIEEKEWAPEQKGKTRATLTVSGWRFTPVGDDLKVTYIVKIALNGSMPIAMVSMVATETPLCTGRARDVYYQCASPPSLPVLPLMSMAGGRRPRTLHPSPLRILLNLHHLPNRILLRPTRQPRNRRARPRVSLRPYYWLAGWRRV
ncbi:hypothetical protein AAT19DRAFT_12337 [Rhodotorula toruloides]|uniref:START domain-containing protein n=1 Tax=Rhodotorula toruloides TaxID=5286 RepID=A0A2T0AFY4_RHOTO|nr:hypothetical protein AAT19DRAFT_12337 [Rhodotorula toruloides]